MTSFKTTSLHTVGISTTLMILTVESASAAGLGGNPNETASLITAIAKIIGALAVVLALMLLLLYIIKKLGLGKGGITRSGSQIKIIETRMVAPKKYIAIAQVAGKSMALGITDNNISFLTDLENQAVSLGSESKNESCATSFTDALQKAASFIKKPQPPDRETT